MAWLDMHLHSCHTPGGRYTPSELLDLCLRSGVRTAAVADRNSVRGIPEARFAAAAVGITLIPAVELDCVFRGFPLQLLGYWIDESCGGLSPSVPLPLAEAAALIRRSGGIPVLAHPGLCSGMDGEMLRAALRAGVDGIEAFSSHHTPAETVRFLQWASEYGAAITCGSDFLGGKAPHLRPGGVDCRGREDEILTGLVKSGIRRLIAAREQTALESTDLHTKG